GREVMKSIRLSLLLYFLTLLAVALGAVSLLVYRTTHQTLLAKKKTTEELIQTQYQKRCGEEKDKLDQQLLSEARHLAQLFRTQVDPTLPYRSGTCELGLLTTMATPAGYLSTPLLVAESTPTPLAFEVIVRPLMMKTEIKLSEEELSQKVHDQV